MKTKKYEIEVTKKCNLRCSYCYIGHVENEYNMSKYIAKNIIDIVSNKIDTQTREVFILFWGGEPLLNFNIIKYFINEFNVIGKSKKVIFTYQIITNGTICSSKIIDFLNKNNVHLQISLDGDKDSHDSCRVKKNGQGSFDNIMINLSRFLSSRKDRHDKRISLSASISNRINDISNSINILNSFNIPFSIGPIFSKNEWKEKDLLLESEIENLFSPMISLFEKEAECGTVNHNNMTFVKFLKNIFSKKRYTNTCNAGIGYFCFGADGKIYLCHRFVTKPACAIGDIIPYSLDRRVIHKQNVSTKTKTGCNSCALKYLCLGTCPYDTVCSNNKNYIDPVICAFSRLFHINIIRILKNLYFYNHENYLLLIDNLKKIKCYNKDILTTHPFEEVSIDMKTINDHNLPLKKSPSLGIVELDNEGLFYLKDNEAKKYIANATTMAIFDLLDGHRTAQQIAQEIANACEVEFEAIKDDIYGQLAAFQELGLVEEVQAESHA